MWYTGKCFLYAAPIKDGGKPALIPAINSGFKFTKQLKEEASG